MKDDDDAPNTSSEIALVKTVAYLQSQGMQGPEIARRLFPKHKDPTAKIARLVARARAARYMHVAFDERCVTPTELEAMRLAASRDPYIDLEDYFRKKSGGHFKELRVFYSASSAADKNTWDLHISRFADNSAWYVSELLDRASNGIAVGWGRTIFELVEALRRNRQRHVGNNLSPRQVTVIPTVGDPVGASPDVGGTSSTKLARTLSEMLTGGSQKVPSLEGIHPVLPRDFDEHTMSAIRGYIRRIVGYSEVFGDGRPSTGKLAKVDTALTSCGAFQSYHHWRSELLVDTGVPVAELRHCCSGDIGGALVPSEAIDTNPMAKTEFEELTGLWTGITLDHFKELAHRAASSSAPGVVLCVIGQNKAKIVHDLIVRFDAVNRLVVDHHLAKRLIADHLENRPAAIRKNS